VSAPSGQVGSYWSCSWVGIDGATSGDVFQAGVEHDVSASGTATHLDYSCWYEWFTSAPHIDSPAVTIENLPVQAGDRVLFSLQAQSPTLGYLLATCANQGVSITFSAPPETTLQGDSAEWIVERPSVNHVLQVLPEFSPVAFTGMLPSPSGLAVNQISMTENGLTVATAVFSDNQAVLVEYSPPSAQCAALYAEIRSAQQTVTDLQAALRSAGSNKASILREIIEAQTKLAELERQKQALGCP
jgi:hypothetical protein